MKMNKLEQLVEETLQEAAKVNFAGHSFLLKVDTNEDPQKKGVKVLSPFDQKKKKEKKNGRRLLFLHVFLFIYIQMRVFLHTSKKK